MTKMERQEFRTAISFLIPWLIGLTMFIIFPVFITLYFSICDYSVLNPPVYIGFGNYYDLMMDTVFWKSLWNTACFAVLALPMGTILSLVLALMLNFNIFARSVFRTIFFLPSLVPFVALAILWGWIFNGQYGILNYFLTSLGIEGPNWLGSTFWSKPALVLTGLWGVGNAVVIYLAGLQDVPRQLYESAKIDGANTVQQIFHVTLPMISPVIYFNLIMGCIGVLQIFILPFIMTQGGPARSTLFYTMYIYDQGFRFLNMGYACAMALILFLLTACLTWIAHKLTIKHVYYGGE